MNHKRGRPRKHARWAWSSYDRIHAKSTRRQDDKRAIGEGVREYGR